MGVQKEVCKNKARKKKKKKEWMKALWIFKCLILQ